MLETYATVQGRHEHEIVIQRSRFIAYVMGVSTEQEAQDFIKDKKKKHWDATHNCSAYLIGDNDEIQKANDDGEPSGTAGVPILEVIKKRKLKNVVIVVTRYFGGVKLGAGGLIRAYGSSASEGLNNSKVIEKRLLQSIFIKTDYSIHRKLESDLLSANYPIVATNFTDSVVVETAVPISEAENFMTWVINKTNGKSSISEGNVKYVDFDIL